MSQANGSRDSDEESVTSRNTVGSTESRGAVRPSRLHSQNAKYRVKHNASEQKRRGKIKNYMTELKSLSGCTKKDQATILSTTINRLREYENRIVALEQERKVEFAVSHMEGNPHLPKKDASKPCVSSPCSSSSLPPLNPDAAANFASLNADPLLSNVACTSISLDGRFLHANDLFCEFIGHNESALQADPKLTMFAVTASESLADTYQMIGKLLSKQVDNWTLYKKCIHKEGHKVACHVLFSTVFAPDKNGMSKPSYYLSLVVPVDVSELSTLSPLVKVDLQRKQQAQQMAQQLSLSQQHELLPQLVTDLPLTPQATSSNSSSMQDMMAFDLAPMSPIFDGNNLTGGDPMQFLS